jgi:hypothetical protein
MQSTANPATEKQVAFATKLIDEMYPAGVGDDNDAEARLAALEFVADADRASISTFIDACLKSLKAAREATGNVAVVTSSIPDGYYAVTYADVLRFYRLKTAKNGMQYVNRFRSDFTDKVFRVEALKVKAEIAGNPDLARTRFAEKTVCCYMCGRRLTDPTSMELGIGPECRSK